MQDLADWLGCEAFVTNFRPVVLSEYILAGKELCDKDGNPILPPAATPGAGAMVKVGPSSSSSGHARHGNAASAAFLCPPPQSQQQPPRLPPKPQLSVAPAGGDEEDYIVAQLSREAVDMGQQVLIFAPTQFACMLTCKVLSTEALRQVCCAPTVPLFCSDRTVVVLHLTHFHVFARNLIPYFCNITYCIRCGVRLLDSLRRITWAKGGIP